MMRKGGGPLDVSFRGTGVEERRRVDDDDNNSSNKSGDTRDISIAKCRFTQMAV